MSLKIWFQVTLVSEYDLHSHRDMNKFGPIYDVNSNEYSLCYILCIINLVRGEFPENGLFPEGKQNELVSHLKNYMYKLSSL